MSIPKDPGYPPLVAVIKLRTSRKTSVMTGVLVNGRQTCKAEVGVIWPRRGCRPPWGDKEEGNKLSLGL
jgi:hypothetical protein